jgi:hypothetical protein
LFTAKSRGRKTTLSTGSEGHGTGKQEFDHASELTFSPGARKSGDGHGGRTPEERKSPRPGFAGLDEADQPVLYRIGR